MSHASPIRWGILATGAIATRFVADLALLPDALVAAVGSRSLAPARDFAERHAIARSYGSWQELAADPDIDVIYVATPHTAHHAAATLCLEAGKAVLCEKPFTLDLATSTDLVATARARRVFLMEAMWMRTNPTVRRIAGLVADGAIGAVTHVMADFGVAGPVPVGHRMRAPELGGGATLDLGVYPVTLSQLLLGPATTVSAWGSLFPEGTDKNTSITLGYDSGAVATLHCGFLGETAQRAVITGDQGRIEVSRPFYCPESFTLIPANGEPREITEPVRGHGMGYEAEEVMRCLRQGLLESPVIPLDSTLDVMRTLSAVLDQLGVSYPASAAPAPSQRTPTPSSSPTPSS